MKTVIKNDKYTDLKVIVYTLARQVVRPIVTESIILPYG